MKTMFNVKSKSVIFIHLLKKSSKYILEIDSNDRSLETFFSGISPLRELCPAINNFMKTHTQVGVIYFVFTVAYSVSFRKSLLYLRDRSIVVPTNKVELC